ncbi:MAG TPA: asparaginase [Candidatus Limnocylindrales bacterium]|nr:asparaginase [Candidatus Limnocylindrales bacterium]
MSRVAVVFTGGTISMVRDPVAGGNVPALDGDGILARTPGLEAIADVVAIDLGRTPASHFSLTRLLEIGGEIRRAQADPAIDGVVVVQGTDTIEETAFLWDLVLDRPEPVVVTGAMRASDQPDYDGPANLRNAVRAAASPSLRGSGVTVCLGGTIEPADTVIKTNTGAFDAFRSLDAPRLGTVGDDGVSLERPRGPRRHVETDRAVEDVVVITATVGMDGRAIDDAARWAGGIVVEATGSGNTSAGLRAAGSRAMERGIALALTTRCPSGAVSPAYAFPGGGATWARAGALLCGHLGGPKARIALACGLGGGLDHAALARLLADPSPGSRDSEGG